MNRRFSSLALSHLTIAATLVSSWAVAATPREAGETPAATSPDSTQVVAQAGAVFGPGLGAAVALDARVVRGLHMGLQGGFFSDRHNGYPFVGARASYRFEASETLRIVPTLGVSHLRVLPMDIDPFRVKEQTPVSITAGLQLAAQLGHFLVGCDFQVMPVHVTYIASEAHGFEQREETIFATPIALFLGATF